MSKLLIYIFLLGLAANFSSCVQHRQLLAFQEGFEAGGAAAIANKVTIRIQPDDILHITVNTLEDEAAQPYNLSGGVAGRNQGGGGGNTGGGNVGNNANFLLLSGYLVDSLGYIDFPGLGRVEVGGLTLEEARNRLAERLSTFLVDPAINVRFLNFRYTIMGEVNAPGTVTTFNKRTTILEAIGSAGDLTPYANRTNVLVIREQNGRRSHARLNLQDDSIFASPYFYLTQNDVIYVEPTQARIATVADPVTRFITYGSAFLSVITLALTIFSR